MTATLVSGTSTTPSMTSDPINSVAVLRESAASADNLMFSQINAAKQASRVNAAIGAFASMFEDGYNAAMAERGDDDPAELWANIIPEAKDFEKLACYLTRFVYWFDVDEALSWITGNYEFTFGAGNPSFGFRINHGDSPLAHWDLEEREFFLRDPSWSGDLEDLYWREMGS